MKLRDVDPVLMEEALSSVDRESLLRDTREISRWTRISGSEEERAAFDYIERRCLEYGAGVVRYNPALYLSVPAGAELELEGHSLPCITHSMAASTPPEGLDVTCVPLAEFSGTSDRLRPPAAVIEGIATPALVLEARRKGAAACIFLAPTDPPPEMIVSPVWGSPGISDLPRLPEIPVVTLGARAAEEFRKLLDLGYRRAHLRTEVRTGWAKSQCLVATVGPADGPFVLLSGHVDSWYHGAMDNAAGNACQIEAVRLFSKLRRKLRRGLRVAFWSGHSHGRYAGSTWYADNFHHELSARCCVHINADCLGARGATVLTEGNVMAETKPVGAALVRKMSGQELTGARFTRMGDQSFWGCGVPSLFVTPAEQPPSEAGRAGAELLGKGARSGGLGPWWHTALDTMDVIDPDNLVRDTRIIIGACLWFACSPLLPLDVADACREVVSGMGSWYRKFLSGYGEGMLDGDPFGVLAGFEVCLTKAREIQRLLEKASAAIDDLGSNASAEVLDGVNFWLMRVERALVRLNYVEAPEYLHDPALPMPPVPLLSPVDAFLGALHEREKCAALAELRRRLNRVLELLDECGRAAAELLLACSEDIPDRRG